MSEKNLQRLVGALVVIVALWGVSKLLSSNTDNTRAASGEIADFLTELEQGSATAVRISSTSGDTELTREGASWMVNGLASDSATVARFWSVVENGSIGELIATNPANHARMEIDDAQAWSLAFDVGGETRTLLIGSQGPRFATSHVRLPGGDEVYLFQGDLRVHLRRQLVDWRNKRIVAIDTTAIARVEISRDGDSYALVRGDTTWVFEDDGGPVKRLTVQNLMMDLNGVQGSGILEATDSLATLEQATSTTAYGSDGSVMAEVTISAGETDRWARSMGDETIYRLQGFRVDRIAPTREDATPEPDGS